MIPGNTPEDAEWDRLFDWISDLGLEPNEIRARLATGDIVVTEEVLDELMAVADEAAESGKDLPLPDRMALWAAVLIQGSVAWATKGRFLRADEPAPTTTELLDLIEDMKCAIEAALDGEPNVRRLDELVHRATDVINGEHIPGGPNV
jgi:hypothetical protein